MSLLPPIIVIFIIDFISLFIRDEIETSLIGRSIENASFNLAFAIFIISLSKNKAYSLTATTLLAINVGLTFFISYTYNSSLNAGITSSILYTDYSEIIEMASTFVDSISLSLLVSCFYFVFLSKVKKALISNARTAKSAYITSSVIILAVIISPFIKHKKIDYIDEHIKSNFTIDYNHHITSKIMSKFSLTELIYLLYFSKKINEYDEIKPAWTNVKKLPNSKDVYVVVIGESAIKEQFGFYNASYSTTPKSVTGLTIYNGVSAPATITRLSVPRILSKNHNERDYDVNLNIISLANSAGYVTYWISNQAMFGKNESAISAIANLATHKTHTAVDYKKSKPDNVLLPIIFKAINENTSKKVIFVHTMGSHPNFCDRFEQNYDTQLTANKTKNCYQNSIKYSFEFLASIRNLLIKARVNFDILYFSDHGLKYINKDPYYLHDVSNIIPDTVAEVPFLFWGNEDHPMEKINKNYNLRNFYSTFADWTRISADQIEKERSIFSASKDTSSRKVLTANLRVVEYQH